MEKEDSILYLYNRFAAKRPVMLYDIQEQKIYAYPYKKYLKTLTPRSQELLKQQYEQAKEKNQIVVFVRDNLGKKFVSFNIDMSEPPAGQSRCRKISSATNMSHRS